MLDLILNAVSKHNRNLYFKLALDIQHRFPLDFEQQMQRLNLPKPSLSEELIITAKQLFSIKRLHACYVPKNSLSMKPLAI